MRRLHRKKAARCRCDNREHDHGEPLVALEGEDLLGEDGEETETGDNGQAGEGE